MKSWCLIRISKTSRMSWLKKSRPWDRNRLRRRKWSKCLRIWMASWFLVENSWKRRRMNNWKLNESIRRNWKSREGSSRSCWRRSWRGRISCCRLASSSSRWRSSWRRLGRCSRNRGVGMRMRQMRLGICRRNIMTRRKIWWSSWGSRI